MPGLRGFRFSTSSFETTRAGLLAEARKAEALGYDVFLAVDHIWIGTAPILLLMMADPKFVYRRVVLIPG